MSILGHVGSTRTALLATAVVALAAGDALAFGHGSWGSSGSSASYGSYASYSSYGSSSSGSYSSGSSSSGSYASSSSSGSYGRPGLFARWHAKKAARASSGSSSSGSYASYSYYGSSGSSSSGSHGSSSGSYGTYSAPVEYYSAPVESGAPIEASPTPAEPAAATGASIRVIVPADAKVFVNDTPTTSTGTERSYVSRGLRSGMSYSYDLRVEFTKDGKTVVENKLVSLTAGQEINLAFGNGAEAAAAESVKTQLTLHVPSEAKVTLAGAGTKQTGELRTYSTASLASGQEWDGYVVRVELMRDGKSIVEEKTLKITGGETYELTFDMAGDAPTVASIN